VRADPCVAGHAAHCVQPGGIDAKVFDKSFKNVEADDLAEDDNASAGSMAGVDDLEEAALHLGGRFGYARWPHHFAGKRSEACELELIDIGCDFGCGQVCMRRDGFADDVDDEFVCFFYIAESVFALFGASGA